MERLPATDRLKVGAGIVFSGGTVSIDDAAGVLSFTDASGTKSLDNIPVAGTAQIDFGAFPGSGYATPLAIAVPSIKAGSSVSVKIMHAATVDHSADEHVADPPGVYGGDIVAGVGFTIYGSFTQLLGGRTYGKWSVAWSCT